MRQLAMDASSGWFDSLTKTGGCCSFQIDPLTRQPSFRHKPSKQKKATLRVAFCFEPAFAFSGLLLRPDVTQDALILKPLAQELLAFAG